MNNIKIFNNAEFGEIRTLEEDNQVWFVGKDIAQALGYSNTADAIQKHVDDMDKLTSQIAIAGQMRYVVTINESGLYSLILSSKLESAKRFKHWVTSEVLPSIRKNGGYLDGQESMSDAEIMAKALMVAQKTIDNQHKQIEAQSKQLEEAKPKVVFADAVSVAKTSILIRDLAKLMRQNGIDIGEKRLYKWMRENGYICKGATAPTQRAMELGLFEVKVSVIERGDDRPIETRTTKVTGKGQIYFMNKMREIGGKDEN